MNKTGKLELTWIGKYDTKRIEPRILVEDKDKSYGDISSSNMLIHGDNLIALQALQQKYAGCVKCIYIDPPYNTGTAFEQYDDGLEHSIWLSIMRQRLLLLQNLLSDDGSIWISIDDDEGHYLKVLCDEIFGRNNFIATCIWQKKHTRANDAKWFSDNHDFILVYANNKELWHPNLLPRTEQSESGYSNPDNDPRGPWQSLPLQARSGTDPNFTHTFSNGVVWSPPAGRFTAFSHESLDAMERDNRIWFGKNGKNVPRYKKFLSEVKDGLVPTTIWFRDEVGDNQEAKTEVKAINEDDVFATPKPERLVHRILTLATKPGDLVLDSFLGSGTTSAVAHKMGRRWIGIELGDHAYTHCKLRLDKVIDGESGGISELVNWNGGGGYHFYELAPSLLVKNNKLPIYQINPAYSFEMLCEAICKIEGFQYHVIGSFHGFSSEERFIHITKEYVNTAYINNLASCLSENQSLLIYCLKRQSQMNLPDNIQIKQIPKDLLEKCEFESEEN